MSSVSSVASYGWTGYTGAAPSLGTSNTQSATTPAATATLPPAATTQSSSTSVSISPEAYAALASDTSDSQIAPAAAATSTSDSDSSHSVLTVQDNGNTVLTVTDQTNFVAGAGYTLQTGDANGKFANGNLNPGSAGNSQGADVIVLNGDFRTLAANNQSMNSINGGGTDYIYLSGSASDYTVSLGDDQGQSAFDGNIQQKHADGSTSWLTVNNIKGVIFSDGTVLGSNGVTGSVTVTQPSPPSTPANGDGSGDSTGSGSDTGGTSGVGDSSSTGSADPTSGAGGTPPTTGGSTSVDGSGSSPSGTSGSTGAGGSPSAGTSTGTQGSGSTSGTHASSPGQQTGANAPSGTGSSGHSGSAGVGHTGRSSENYLPALMNLYPKVEQAILYETQAILTALPQVIGSAILGGFGMGAVAAVNNLVKQQNQLLQLIQAPTTMTGTNKTHRHAFDSLASAYTGALNSLTAFQLAGQFLQQSLDPSSSTGTVLQSRLTTISNAQRVASDGLKLLSHLSRSL